MNSSIAIKVEGLSKKYEIGSTPAGSFRESLIKVFQKSNVKNEFWALNDLDFEIKKGDVVGIIGKNGAGKSTLLKILSQITKPTKGRVSINGRIASLLEVGTGFHPELTGRENIFLNGTILGMTRKEVALKFDEILAFSGVEKFVDTPVKRYSSGMYVRLAFAVAAHLEPEILIIDEVLAVGDSEFQKKCLGKMKDVSNDGRTVLFVSHQLGTMRQLCNSGLLLSNGSLLYQGTIEQTIAQYQQNHDGISYISPPKQTEYFIKYFKVTDKSVFQFDEKINLSFEISTQQKEHQKMHLLVYLCNYYGAEVACIDIPVTEFNKTLNFSIDAGQIIKGDYTLSLNLYAPGVKSHDSALNCVRFGILDNKEDYLHLEKYEIGSLYLKGTY